MSNDLLWMIASFSQFVFKTFYQKLYVNFLWISQYNCYIYCLFREDPHHIEETKES